jgi:hypothetical protein
MTFNIPSFFVGIAATLGILTVGFGGGVMMSGVLSDGTHQPNRVERQAARETPAKESKETKPTIAPVVVTVPAQAAPTDIQAAVSAPEPVVSQTPPQAEPQPAQQAPAQQTAAQVLPPALGPQRPVSLTQPVEESRPSPNLSRREEARLKAQKWRDERAQRREERRKQWAERRRQDEMRRAERRIVEQYNRPDADDDDDERPIVRQPGFFGGPFGLFR